MADIAATSPYALAIGPFGSNLLTSDFVSEGVPVVFVRNVRPGLFVRRADDRCVSNEKAASLHAHRVSPGDLVVTKMGDPPGIAAIYPLDAPPGVITADILKVTADPTRVSPTFLCHYLNSDLARAAVARFTFGVTRQKVTLADFRRMPVPLPPLPEQRRIAAILDQADAIRRKRREALALVEKLASSAFLEMFGDPVRNPKGWPVRKLADFADSQYGTAAKANTEGRGIPVLRMGNITYDGRIDLTDVKWCEIAPDEMASYTVRRGDLLFNRTNSPELVGKTAVWNRDETFAFAGYLVRVRFQPGLLPEYVSGFLNSRYGKKLLFETAKPSNNMSNLNATELLRIRLPVPSSEKQQGFAHIVTALHDVRSHRATALSEADTLFHALAQRAFRGEL